MYFLLGKSQKILALAISRFLRISPLPAASDLIPASCIPSFLDQGVDKLRVISIRDPYNGFLYYPNWGLVFTPITQNTKSLRLFHCSGESQGAYPFWIENSVPEKPSKAQKCWVNPLISAFELSISFHPISSKRQRSLPAAQTKRPRLFPLKCCYPTM